MSRAEWMQQRAALLQRRYDELHAPVYDSQYADLSPVGLKLVATLLERCPPGGVVLDAGCGTGIWWPTILSRGLRVVGVDQSAGMLQHASAKHPQVEVHVRHLDELAFDRDFDAAICVEVLEMVFPEKWPLALGGLARAVREGSLIYLTIEKPPGDLGEVFMAAQRAGWPVQVGESSRSTSSTSTRPTDQVDAWLESAGLCLERAMEANSYHHRLVVRRTLTAPLA